MNSITRTFRFIVFTLVEYARSGRILVECLATVIFFYLFFRRWTTPPPSSYFFSTAGLFVLGLTFYTTSAMMGIGDRPQGYVLLVRRISRASYLLGLYLTALAITSALYGTISIGMAVYNPVADLDLRGWVLGSLPLLLNAALFGALLTLLAPIVLTAGWRLAVLALVAIAFSGNLLGGQTVATIPQAIATGLSILRTIFSTPLLPAFTGFQLSVDRDYSGIHFLTPITQLTLTISLLSLAVYSFRRRDVIFSTN
jgi:hypothetical protein